MGVNVNRQVSPHQRDRYLRVMGITPYELRVHTSVDSESSTAVEVPALAQVWCVFCFAGKLSTRLRHLLFNALASRQVDAEKVTIITADELTEKPLQASIYMLEKSLADTAFIEKLVSKPIVEQSRICSLPATSKWLSVEGKRQLWQGLRALQ